jgi:hypothetical protein
MLRAARWYSDIVASCLRAQRAAVQRVWNTIENSDRRKDGYWEMCFNRAMKELRPLKITNEVCKKEVWR